jgi:acetoin utilization deacetylase AcuC-like enzyme
MLAFKLIYHDGYDLNLGSHVFPSQKFRLIRERLLSEGFADPADFAVPAPASDEDLMLVHDRRWVTHLKQGTLDDLELMKLEIPYGTILAARLAIAHGLGFNIGGGFHPAFPDHGEGFCAINDIAVGTRRLQQERLIERAMVVDADVHNGNGAEAIFSGDDAVCVEDTVTIHCNTAMAATESVVRD